MKIGFALDRYDEGVGMANVVFKLAKELSASHDIIILTLDNHVSDNLEKIAEKQGVSIKRFSSRSGLKLRFKIRKHAQEIDELDLDVVSAHGFHMANAAALSNTPVLKTNHAHTLIKSEFLDHPVRLPLWMIEEIPSVYLSDEIVSISNYARNQMKKIYRRDSEVIYNGVDLETYQPKSSRDFLDRYDVDSNKKILGTLCALRNHKNIDLAIEALAEIDEDYVYLVGGTGPEKNRLKKKAEKKDVNVKFLGFVEEEELPEFYSSLDLFLFPSLWEGFGVPVLEAMACGTPAMVLDQKGPKELVLDGKTGYCLSKDVNEWSEKITEFFSTNESMKDESRKRARQFSWAEKAKEYEKKLQELA